MFEALGFLEGSAGGGSRQESRLSNVSPRGSRVVSPRARHITLPAQQPQQQQQGQAQQQLPLPASAHMQPPSAAQQQKPLQLSRGELLQLMEDLEQRCRDNTVHCEFLHKQSDALPPVNVPSHQHHAPHQLHISHQHHAPTPPLPVSNPLIDLLDVDCLDDDNFDEVPMSTELDAMLTDTQLRFSGRLQVSTDRLGPGGAADGAGGGSGVRSMDLQSGPFR
eukprot:115386-Chlamydomonas_euryale.AAC.6